MNNINIFVAGAKELSEARRMMKVVANNLNAEYDSKRMDVHVTMYSYENFADSNQASYNEFIEHEADIVIFMLEGRIGSKTELEFKLASEGLYRRKRPKIYVFVKSYDQLTPDIAYINGLMSNLSKDYYREYRSYDHLESIAKDTIRGAVDSILQNGIVKSASANRDELRAKLRHQRSIIAVLIIFIVGLSLFAFGFSAKEPSNVDAVECDNRFASDQPLLLTIGGGSVANFVQDSLKINLNDDEGLLYVHMPSMSAPALLGEEIFEPSPRYYTFMFSAEKVDEEAFYETTNIGDVHTRGCVIGAHLCDDPLCVYVEDDPLVHKYLDSCDVARERISMSALLNILRHDNQFSMYSTSPTSGTRAKYVDELSQRGVQFKQYPPLNEKKAPKRKDANSPIVILSSQNYASETFNRIKLYLYDTVDGKEQILAKNMYVYFVGYGVHHIHGDDADRDRPEAYVFIPQPIVDFLARLHIDTSAFINNNYINLEQERPLYYINE